MKFWPYSQRNIFHLWSDHHLLRLSIYHPANQQLEMIAETYCESLTEDLVAWLKTQKQLKGAKLKLLLSDDLFHFTTCHPFLTKNSDTRSARFLTYLYRELEMEQNSSQFLIDAVLNRQECQVALLEKAAVIPYMNAFKQCRIQLIALSPYSACHFNLLPWRLREVRTKRIKITVQVLYLPLIVLLIMAVFVYQSGVVMNNEQSRQQHLKEQLKQLQTGSTAIVIAPVLQILNKLNFKSQSISMRQLNLNAAEKKVTLTGLATNQKALDAFLQDLAAWPEVQPNSLRNLVIRQEGQTELWQIEFLLP